MTGPRFLAGFAVIIFLLEGSWFLGSRERVIQAGTAVLSWFKAHGTVADSVDEEPPAPLADGAAGGGARSEAADQDASATTESRDPGAKKEARKEEVKKKDAKKEDAKAEPAEAAKESTKEPSKAADPLEPLPLKNLPPQTRLKPDPEKSQFQRAAVLVQVEETVKPSKGDVYTPKVRVVENYLQEYLRRAGHPIVARPEDAVYRVEVGVQAEFDKELMVNGRRVAYKYGGSSSVRVLGRDGRELEKLEIPQVFRESAGSEEDALLQLDRYMAKVVWDNLFHKGSSLGNGKIIALLNSLAIEGAAQPEGEPETGPLTAEQIIASLVDLGLEAVPYLLDALIDDRIVRVESKYPGLKGRNLDDLKIYHLADKALEEIFQKVSRMSLDTSDAQRFRIIAGWANEWRRFCKPFRESPAPRANKKDAPPESKAPPARARESDGGAPEGR
jgi:hypothetical protein